MNSFEAYIEKRGIKNTSFAEILNVLPPSWNRKKKQPEKFSVEEVIKIAEFLKISPGELINIIMKNNGSTNERKG